VLSSGGNNAAAIAAPSAGLLWCLLLGCGGSACFVAAIEPAVAFAPEANPAGNVPEVREVAGPVAAEGAGVGAAAAWPRIRGQWSPPAGPVFGMQLPERIGCGCCIVDRVGHGVGWLVGRCCRDWVRLPTGHGRPVQRGLPSAAVTVN